MFHLLEEEEEHEISDGCPKNVSETLPKHPEHLGPDQDHVEDHVCHEETKSYLFIGGGVRKKLSL